VYGTGSAQIEALGGLDLEIAKGEFVAVMGPSGSGKSTAMNIIGYLDTPSTGEYLFDGVSVEGASRTQRAALRRHFVGFVFQGYNLLPGNTALENVELPLIYRGVKPAERRLRAADALSRVGMTGREDHRPSQLSGGEQQRVAIARSIVTNPLLLLADEPTGNLDTERAKGVIRLLSDLNEQDGITIIMVTHEPDMAALCHRRIRIVDGRVQMGSGSTTGVA
jgi:putative ABC transport system ATP-binding protein